VFGDLDTPRQAHIVEMSSRQSVTAARRSRRR
jgi:hypothetical protein